MIRYAPMSFQYFVLDLNRHRERAKGECERGKDREGREGGGEREDLQRLLEDTMPLLSSVEDRGRRSKGRRGGLQRVKEPAMPLPRTIEA